MTPTRFLWIHPEQYTSQLIRNFSRRYIHSLKEWDKVAAMRPDHIISISDTVAERCEKYYSRKSSVIYPPFDESHWGKFKKMSSIDRDYYLIVGRLEPYKNVQLAIDAFATLPDHKLIIIGEGSQYHTLKGKATHNVSFVPQASDPELAHYYSCAKALIMPQEEDFGYVSIEAQYFGCPIIAYKKGGATETVHESAGFFFDKQSIPSLQTAITKFDIISYTFKEGLKQRAKSHLNKFSKSNFESKFKDFISSKLKNI